MQHQARVRRGRRREGHQQPLGAELADAVSALPVRLDGVLQAFEHAEGHERVLGLVAVHIHMLQPHAGRAQEVEHQDGTVGVRAIAGADLDVLPGVLGQPQATVVDPDMQQVGIGIDADLIVVEQRGHDGRNGRRSRAVRVHRPCDATARRVRYARCPHRLHQFGMPGARRCAPTPLPSDVAHPQVMNPTNH